MEPICNTVAILNRSVRGLLDECKANVATMFALTAPVLLMGMAVALQYTDAVTIRQQMQASVDAAALAAVTSYLKTQNSTTAASAAWDYLQANTPTALYNSNDFTVTTPQNLNNTVMVSVSYTNSAVPTVLSGVLGFANLQVNVNATAQGALNTAASHDQTYSGVASLWGDPHLTGVDDNTTVFACPNNPTGWYAGLSDAGIQMNFNCEYDSYWSYWEVTNFTFVIGAHTIQVWDNQPTYVNVPANLMDYTAANFDYNNQGWFGAFVLDGETINPPAGWSQYDNGLVQAWVGDTTTPNQYDNYITITYKNGPTQYVFSITFGYWGEGQLSVTATDAGLCGVPGGMLGQTLAGVDNGDVIDYSMPSQFATSPPYSWATCSAKSAVSTTAHLVQ